jgi:predicted membrane-bound mannosyltransferase
LFGLVLAAGVARFIGLEKRPMHADEAILADKFGSFSEKKGYFYDPTDYHGPVLAYLTWIPSRLTGRVNYQSLTEGTLRVVPAVAGLLLAFSALLLLSPPAGTRAAAFVAVSPAMIFYSRYFIPEMLLALWTALFLAFLLRGWWAAAGLAAALMLATKETAVVAILSAAVAYGATFRRFRGVLFLIGALAVGVSLFGLPAARIYFERGVGGGAHAHPWYTYLRWLGTTEAPILIAAAAGAWIAWVSGKPAHRFLAAYSAMLLILYSLISYKTPWCAVSPLFAFCLLAGIAASAATGYWRAGAFAGLACLAVTAWFANTKFDTDPRNPWVYAHTGPGVFTIRDRVDRFAAASQGGPIDIYTTQNLWPLPWYLRKYPAVRWWRQVSIPGPAAPIVLVTPELEADLVRKIYEGPPPGERELYMNLFEKEIELRPQVEVRGYVSKSVWDRAESR